jgi:hypothetical protein
MDYISVSCQVETIFFSHLQTDPWNVGDAFWLSLQRVLQRNKSGETLYLDGHVRTAHSTAGNVANSAILKLKVPE